MLIHTGYLKQYPQTKLVPTLDLDFTRMGNGAPWDSRLSFSRSSTATYKNSSGIIQTVPENTPRFGYNSNGDCLGLLIEEKRANYLYNSSSPATQTKNLTLGNYIVWMEGTGSLSITSDGISGNITEGSIFRFILSATQNVVFTVSGTVTAFQCEKFSTSLSTDYTFPTSFIYTSSDSTVTRQQDILSFSSMDWFNNTEGVFIIETMLCNQMQKTMYLLYLTNGDSGTIINILYQSAPSQRALIRNNSNTEFDNTYAVSADQTPVNLVEKMALGFKENDFIFATNGVIRGTDYTGAIPTINAGYIGANNTAGSAFSGYIRRLTFWDKRLDNEIVRLLTT